MKPHLLALAAAITLLAPDTFCQEVTEIPEPLTAETGRLVVAEDGSATYETSRKVLQTEVRRIQVDSTGKVICEIWDLAEDKKELLQGALACEKILGADKAAETLRIASVLSEPQGVVGPAWTCTNDAVFRGPLYVACDVRIVEYEDDGGQRPRDRTFSAGQLDYWACTNWCMTHWQVEPEQPLGDLIMQCGGGHDDDDHPAYVPPSEG